MDRRLNRAKRHNSVYFEHTNIVPRSHRGPLLMTGRQYFWPCREPPILDEPWKVARTNFQGGAGTMKENELTIQIGTHSLFWITGGVPACRRYAQSRAHLRPISKCPLHSRQAQPWWRAKSEPKDFANLTEMGLPIFHDDGEPAAEVLMQNQPPNISSIRCIFYNYCLGFPHRLLPCSCNQGSRIPGLVVRVHF
jgi:hypothetical protein